MLSKFITSFIEIPFWATHHHVNASTSNNTQNGNTWERSAGPGVAAELYTTGALSSTIFGHLFHLILLADCMICIPSKCSLFSWQENHSNDLVTSASWTIFLCKPPALRLRTVQYAQPIHIINDYDLLALLLLVLLLLILVVVMCSSKRNSNNWL